MADTDTCPTLKTLSTSTLLHRRAWLESRAQSGSLDKAAMRLYARVLAEIITRFGYPTRHGYPH